jgi:protocatechuate 3,4-dioxygenase beta subunit
MIPFVTLAAAVAAGLGAVPLRGKVVSEGGGPVAGATVVLTGAKVSGGPSVVARGTTDDQGQFALERPEHLGDAPWPRPRLWVAAPGRGIASIGFRGPLPGADEPARVTLGSPGRAEFRVRKPDGSPAAGARVRVTRVKTSEYVEVPDELEGFASATTDAGGRAVIDAFAPREVTNFEAKADGFGIQPRDEFPPTPGLKTITLRAVGRLEGRLIAEGPVDFKGWRVSADTRPSEPGQHTWPSGRGTSEVDPNGRYAIPEIAAGRLSFWIEWPDESPVLPEFTKVLPAVAAGRSNAADIPLKPSTTVVGTVRERDTGAPVDGVKLHFFRPGENGSKVVVTDARGQFTVRSLGGKAKLWVSQTPKTHVEIPRFRDDDIAVPPGPGRFELKPIEVRRAAPPLRGVVRDEDGRPVPSATVDYVWSEQNEGGSYRVNADATTDAAGAFALGGIAPGAEVAVTARRKDRITPAPLTAKAGQAEELALRIDPSGTVAVAGRVTGPGGAPVSGAEVKLTARIMEKGLPGGFHQVAFDEMGSELTTATDGSFRSPKELDRRAAEFRAEVTAPGFKPGLSTWMAADEGLVVALPDISLVRSHGPREVAGRVEGSNGRPVARARVFQSGNGAKRTETAADADGAFRLPDVPGGAALVFAEAPGFRLGGMIVGDDGAGAVIRLARESEPPPPREEVRPPMTRAEERALARQLLAPPMPLQQHGMAGGDQDRVDPARARVDPGRALEMIEDRVLPNPGPALIAAALGQFEDDPAAAVATIEADHNPQSRATGFLALAAMVPRSEPDRRGEFLERTLAEARRVDAKEARLGLLGRVADGWLAIDRLGRARSIIVEGRNLIATLPKGQFFFGIEEFGEVLGVIDLPAARDLFERKAMTNVSPTDATQVDRHLGNLAVRLAPFDPVAAERIVRALRPSQGYSDREILILQTCRAMAAADRARARGLLDALGDETSPGKFTPLVFKQFGLGLMAEALGEADPAAARSLLDEAFTSLRAASDRAQGGPTSPPAACVMAGLLPTVAKVDPARLVERTWLAVSCRSYRPPAPTPSMNVHQERPALMEDAALAVDLTPFDRRLADVVAGPIFERLPGLAVEPESVGEEGVRLFRAVAAYDPRRVAPLLAALPEVAKVTRKDANGWTRISLEARARLAAAEVLGLPPSMRAGAALRFFEMRWPIDGPE